MVRGAGRQEKEDSMVGLQDGQWVDHGQVQMSGQLWNRDLWSSF